MESVTPLIELAFSARAPAECGDPASRGRAFDQLIMLNWISHPQRTIGAGGL